jgi:DNA invertase Pin-like site-specific DNA recombinase
MANGQTVGYIRVSSVDQNAARQLEGLKLDRVFQDKVSGKDTNRPALQDMLSFVRDGDTVVVHSIDRLARNLVDLRNLVTALNDKGATVTFVKDSLTFKPKDNDNPANLLMLSMMGAFAEFERSMIRERQREGIAAAKALGRPMGRPASLTSAQKATIKQRAAKGDSKAALAAEFKVTRATVYAALKDAGNAEAVGA